ncbi:MAG: phospholipase A [Gammaproteobacteria bacterium]|nr:phospholipase A [Gammaproteobacteria bacterium]MCW9003617.1 phospholipase A [Gammaproteobacteria bacterium]MCW9056769.1 phospholipase A [Gammaproteobacteria bacterium]
MQNNIIIYCLILLASINTHAASDCSSIQDNTARLTCFDKQASLANDPAVSATTDSDDFVLPEEQFKYLTKLKPFRFTTYEPVYFLPVAFTSNPNNEALASVGEVGQEKVEVKFQLSTRTKIANDLLHKNGDLWLGYTQKSFWQLYNDASSPFRETNYKPELWFSLETQYELFGVTNRFIDIGVTHESNGRGLDLSRSWNRAFIRFGLEDENLAIFVMPWSRINIDEIDNNPNIEDYVGRAEIKIIYQNNERILAGIIRNNFKLEDNRGSYELNWVFPMSGNLKGMIQYFDGYGESLIDYDIRVRRFSIGLVIFNWL